MLSIVFGNLPRAASDGAIACAASERQRRFRRDRWRPAPARRRRRASFSRAAGSSNRWSSTPPGAKPITLKGTGVLTYDDFGNMEMNIKADEASSDLLRAGGMVIPDGVISTTGRTAIDLQNKTLTYIVEGQASAMKTGGGPLSPNRPRHWEVSGDVLTLTTKDDSGAPLSVSRWKKS